MAEGIVQNLGGRADFPPQRVSWEEKQKPYWYCNSIDYIISMGMSMNDRSETETQINILHGNIPQEFYKKTLNPYNTDKEKYKRFPATMRNLDIMSDIIRRYVSEYHKSPHDFIVGASNPEIVLNKNAKLKEEILLAAQQAFIQEFQARFQQMQDEAAQQGIPADQLNPQNAMPNPEEFIKQFEDKYIDDESKQGQEVLEFIRSCTDDIMIYLSAFQQWVSFGECYSYTDIRGEQIVKENVPIIEAYPIPNNKQFVEDHDMFARKMMLSYQQIMDLFDDDFTDRDRDFLKTYYYNRGTTARTQILYSQYFETYADICDKYTDEDRSLFSKQKTTVYENNTGLFEVWHVVWRGEAKKGILTYVNEAGFITTRVVDEDYELNKAAGDISIEWEYDTQIYEGYRIGTRSCGIYPIKCRPIKYSRNNKLPYNGIMEVLPFMGKFSIVATVTPFQIMRNIFAYHREMLIAKNKLLILLLPKSLVSGDEDDIIYRMAADGVLYANDEDDQNTLKLQQVRLLNANIGDYIRQVSELIDQVRQEAWDTVDMNAQRYGDIQQSAGVGTTQEAVARSSMGSVIIVTVFDEFRKRDYQRDLEYAKLAYIDGLEQGFHDVEGNRHYLSLDVNSYVYSSYGVSVKNDAKTKDKLEQLRQWAFSAAQNGDLDAALAAITGDNIAQITDTIKRFNEIKQEHEAQMQQIEAMLKQEDIQNRLKEIEAKGEQDRLLENLKYEHELALKYIDIDTSLDNTDDAKNRLTELTENNKREIERSKLELERQKIQADLYNKAADRAIKKYDVDMKVKIAKTNKNKYDRK